MPSQYSIDSTSFYAADASCYAMYLELADLENTLGSCIDTLCIRGPYIPSLADPNRHYGTLGTTQCITQRLVSINYQSYENHLVDRWDPTCMIYSKDVYFPASLVVEVEEAIIETLEELQPFLWMLEGVKQDHAVLSGFKDEQEWLWSEWRWWRADYLRIRERVGFSVNFSTNDEKVRRAVARWNKLETVEDIRTSNAYVKIKDAYERLKRVLYLVNGQIEKHKKGRYAD